MSCKGEQKMHQSSGMAMLFMTMIHCLSVFIVIILFIIAAVNSGAAHSGSYSWHVSMLYNLFVGLVSMLQVCLRMCVQRSLAAAGKESYEMVTTGNPSLQTGRTGRVGNKGDSPTNPKVVRWSPDAQNKKTKKNLK
jgi:heme/copper-type cytochrome/quinol oxidase subunit 2